jgi:heterodisulfide reductase subunit B
MMRFYPGCTLSSSARPYGRSISWVCERLGIEMEELPDWTCCGATSAHALNKDLSYVLPARNLAIAQGLGDDLVVACSACYSRLKIAQRALENSKTRERVAGVLGRPLDGQVQIKNILEVLGAQMPRIQKERTKALEGLKVACYYGCLATRIPRVAGFDDREHPTMMERLVSAAGATPIEWPAKTSCCGASFSVINEAMALKMSSQILEMARRVGADMLVTSCPFCQYNLDWAQWQLKQSHTVPVLFITQLVGLGLGGSERELMLNAHLSGSRRMNPPAQQVQACSSTLLSPLQRAFIWVSRMLQHPARE